MKVSINIDIQPFSTPNFVLATAKSGQNSGSETSYPLSDFDPETLDRLCDQFRTAVFKKAGKNEPARCA